LIYSILWNFYKNVSNFDDFFVKNQDFGVIKGYGNTLNSNHKKNRTGLELLFD